MTAAGDATSARLPLWNRQLLFLFGHMLLLYSGYVLVFFFLDGYGKSI